MFWITLYRSFTLLYSYYLKKNTNKVYMRDLSEWELVYLYVSIFFIRNIKLIVKGFLVDELS